MLQPLGTHMRSEGLFLAPPPSGRRSNCDLGFQWTAVAPPAREGRPAAELGATTMISWLPDDVLRAACQMACYGFAALTAAVTFLFVPRW